jgi:hypothetical protein
VDYVDIVQVANVLCYAATPGHPLFGIDTETLPAFQRVGVELVASLQSGDASAAESDISLALH